MAVPALRLPRGRKQARRLSTSRSPRAWCERAWIQLPDPDLAYLVEGTDEFWAYIRDLRWAQHFALLNREEMMARAAECLAEFVGRGGPGGGDHPVSSQLHRADER